MVGKNKTFWRPKFTGTGSALLQENGPKKEFGLSIFSKPSKWNHVNVI